MKVDSAGDVWVSNTSLPCSVLTCRFSITEYAPGASGDVAPICKITKGLSYNDDISLEPDGTIFVGNLNSSVSVYGADACDNADPLRIISGLPKNLDGVGVDATGTLYADDTLGNSIQVFSPGASGNAQPERSISGPDTNLSGPDDVVVGFDGELYVTNGFNAAEDRSSVEVFAPGASGDVSPTQDISGANTDLTGADDLAVDAIGNIYVTDFASKAVVVFSPGATGDVPPISRISGPNTNLVFPEGVAVAGPPAGASATVTTEASNRSIPQGGSTLDTARILGGTSAPTGSLVFELFGPDDSTCANAPVFTSAAIPVNGAGAYTSPSFTPTTIGVYRWQALYSGDASNAAATTPCGDPRETVADGVASTGPSLNTSLSGGGSAGLALLVAPGTPVTDSATLVGSSSSPATGKVTYNIYSDSSCNTLVSAGTPEPINPAGTFPASDPVAFPTNGTYYWLASYSGDANNAPLLSFCGSEVETVAVYNSNGDGCIASLTAPTHVSAVPGEMSATLSWTPVTSNPPNCLQGYVVTPSIGSPFEVLGTGTTAVVPGLTDGKSVTFTVAGANGSGVGPQSAPTKPITIGAPAAPRATAAARIHHGALKVYFAAPPNNGAAITTFKAVCRSSNGGVTRGRIGSASPLGVKNLTKGKTYTCNVTASNSRGSGPPSAPSAPVIP